MKYLISLAFLCVFLSSCENPPTRLILKGWRAPQSSGKILSVRREGQRGVFLIEQKQDGGAILTNTASIEPLPKEFFAFFHSPDIFFSYHLEGDPRGPVQSLRFTQTNGRFILFVSGAHSNYPIWKQIHIYPAKSSTHDIQKPSSLQKEALLRSMDLNFSKIIQTGTPIPLDNSKSSESILLYLFGATQQSLSTQDADRASWNADFCIFNM